MSLDNNTNNKRIAHGCVWVGGAAAARACANARARAPGTGRPDEYRSRTARCGPCGGCPYAWLQSCCSREIESRDLPCRGRQRPAERAPGLLNCYVAHGTPNRPPRQSAPIRAGVTSPAPILSAPQRRVRTFQAPVRYCVHTHRKWVHALGISTDAKFNVHLRSGVEKRRFDLQSQLCCVQGRYVRAL